VETSDLPVYSLVLNGEDHVFPGDKGRLAVKASHEFAMKQMPFDLIQNINRVDQLSKLPAPHREPLKSTKQTMRVAPAVMLLTEKNDTSSLYVSLAYQYRRYARFGESSAKTLRLAK